MKRILSVLMIGLMAVSLGGCNVEAQKSQKTTQAEKASQAANQIRFAENAEIDNIKRRIELTAQPGLLGYILLLNNAGQPIMYEGVVGKVSSSGKRLTPPVQEWNTWGETNPLGPAPSDEGTWGSSAEYIFYWNTNGQYRQWNGMYLYSDKPFRLTTEPLVVSLQPPSAATK